MPGGALLLRLAGLGLLAAFLLAPHSFAPLFAPLTQYGAPAIYDQGDLLTLALAQVGTVLCATAASTLVAVGLGILVTRARGASFFRCRARWSTSARPFRQWRCWRSPCRWSALASGPP